MSMTGGDAGLLLPPRSRLLYIGPPKTGTTSVQEAARAARPQLSEHGVYYPGNRRNHRREISALLGRPYRMVQGAPAERAAAGATPEQAMRTPPISAWRALMADIASHESERIMISHEVAASATDDQAATVVDELGPDRIHVAISLRPLASVIPSWWNELVKSGFTEPFSDVLLRLYGRAEPPVSPIVLRYFDHGGLVERWARAAGPANVTVIVADPANKRVLPQAFEDMLGLPRSTLAGADRGGYHTNRSLSRPEAELFRAVNAAIDDPEQMSWRVHARVVQTGAVAAVLDDRVPDDDEPRILMPAWAAELAVGAGTQHAERIARSGVRVVGDLASLHADPAVAEDVSPADDRIPLTLAVRALSGAVAGALRSEREMVDDLERARQLLDREKKQHATTRARVRRLRARSIRQQVADLPRDAVARTAAESFGTRVLAGALALRLWRRLRVGRLMRRR